MLLEQQRLANIARNRALLQQLNLPAPAAAPPAKRAKSTKTARPTRLLSPPAPTRRSRRIAGIKSEDTAEARALQAELDAEAARREELERIRTTKLTGDVLLGDILTNDNPELLEKIRYLGKTLSTGDVYREMAALNPTTDRTVAALRKQFDGFGLEEAPDTKLTPERINAMCVHPGDVRVVVAGDTVGHVGIWTVDEGPEAISTVKIHGKALLRIQTATDATKIATASYDGLVRLIDLTTLNTTEAVFVDGEGISDLVFGEPNVAYFTTLLGLFGQQDLREKPKTAYKLLRLHDKKIGGFLVRPGAGHQMATGLLDRTMRVWDLRTSEKAEWLEFGGNSPGMVSLYQSGLSVLSTDWSTSNRVVCNGYDNLVCVFDMEKTEEGELEDGLRTGLMPTTTIRHNCQTGRWVLILKSRWQPAPEDGVSKFAIANMKRGIDIFAEDGTQVGHLEDERMTAVPAVLAWHPRRPWLVGGSASGKAYLYQ